MTIKANDPCWCGSERKFKRCHRSKADRVESGVVSERRTVPDQIIRPDYAGGGRPIKTTEPLVKDPGLIEAMRQAGRVAAHLLAMTGAAVAPGVTTDEFDAIAHEA